MKTFPWRIIDGIFFIVLFLPYSITGNVAFGKVVINEIHYNPKDHGFQAGLLREFVELYNPQSVPINLSHYRFTDGIRFRFPVGSIIEPKSFLVVVKDPENATWTETGFPVYGPYQRKLANGGERLTLNGADGTIVDSVLYSDDPPWPRAPDGYGSSLERISWDLPPDDFHSWRASLIPEGTPGAQNSITGTIPKPVITTYKVEPPNPTSAEHVKIRFQFDAADSIRSATLRWEIADRRIDDRKPTFLVMGTDIWNYWPGQTAPSEGLNWTEIDFDDSNWSKGPGSYGYGTVHGYSSHEFIATPLNGMKDRYSTVFIRRPFYLNNPQIYKSLNLYVYFNDGFVCYLNGVEVARSNAPKNISHTSFATSTKDDSRPQITEVQNVNRFLVEGKNVISLVGLNDKLNSGSFAIGAFLQEGKRYPVMNLHTVPMQKLSAVLGRVTYEGTIPPNPSQTLVRFNVQLQLSDDRTIILPHVAAIRPFESFFVYDKEIQSRFHVMWLFESGRTALPEHERIVTGAVIQPENSSTPLVFDGALIYPSRQGQKLRFLKGEEYRNDRTLNIISERPQGETTAGPSSPHREHLAYWFYKEMGVLSPRSEWFRIIHLPDPGRRFHSQQLVIQHVNEAFLEMNGRDRDADLYKRNFRDPVWEKHTNKEQGIQSITDLINKFLTRNPEERHNALNSNLVIDEFMAYSVASVLMCNWDGFHNNHWMYLDPTTEKWEIVPWDLDQVWGFAGTNSTFVEMPVDFPLNGLTPHFSREPGPVTRWLHEDEKLHQTYKNKLVYELNHALTQERMDRKIDEVQAILLEDLLLLESQTNTEHGDRRRQILDSYHMIKDFVRLRREYLISEIGTFDTELGDPSNFSNGTKK